MPDTQLHDAILQRLRFERAMGLETVVPIRQPVPLAAPSSLPGAPSAERLPHVTPTAEQEPVEATDKATRWLELERRAKACLECALSQGRQKVVFDRGNRSARLCFVGEAPGFDEDRQGLPFVGKAGQLLDKIIGAMGLRPEDVYICNVVKCRPPENRKPLPDEIVRCLPFLDEQIALVEPKVIVALGGTAASALLNTTQGIMRLRGHWASYKGIPVMPTYHPAFVLRQYTEEVRRAVWEDMKQVVEKLGHG